MSKLSKRIILLFFVIISLGFVGLFVIDKATNSRINNIGVIGKVPNFSLTNFDGEEVTSSILNNKITIVNFMFTQCEDACLIMSENLSLLQERFAQSNDIQFLSITTDPDFDSLEILNDYQKKYSKKNNWFFARGNIIDIINLSEKGFCSILRRDLDDNIKACHAEDPSSIPGLGKLRSRRSLYT